MTRAHEVGGDTRRRMLAGVPVLERRLRLAGVSTAVLEGGDGPPLVLLHGAIECGGPVWAPVIARLAERHRVVVPDLPGLGESHPVDRLDVTMFAEWFSALLRETCPERPRLVAHSLAGSLAARFAAARGDLLRSLVLYAAPGIGPYRLPLGLRVVAMRFALRPTAANAERFERFATFDLDRTRRRDPQWFESFSADTRRRAAVKDVKRTMGRMIKVGTTRIPVEELRRIEVPTALLWGRQDRFVPLALAQAASTGLGWPLRVIDDAGHIPHIERPEAFLGALDAVGEGARGG